MSRPNASLIALLAILCGLAALVGRVPTAAAADGQRHILVLGRISDDPKIHYEQLKPLLDYVVPGCSCTPLVWTGLLNCCG